MEIVFEGLRPRGQVKVVRAQPMPRNLPIALTVDDKYSDHIATSGGTPFQISTNSKEARTVAKDFLSMSNASVGEDQLIEFVRQYGFPSSVGRKTMSIKLLRDEISEFRTNCTRVFRTEVTNCEVAEYLSFIFGHPASSMLKFSAVGDKGLQPTVILRGLNIFVFVQILQDSYNGRKIKACQNCQSLFVPGLRARRDVKFCGDACRQAAHRRKKSDPK